MNIVDFSEKYAEKYFLCLEDWSDELKEAGNRKEQWFNQMKEKGLRVKLAVEDEKALGMVQYIPVEYSVIDGQDCYFINCIWVHGYKQGVGNWQKKGIGSQLLAAAEADVKVLGRKGVAAWGLGIPVWMKASWYKKHGYKKIDADGAAVLVWKAFTDDAVPPKWIKQRKVPGKSVHQVSVTSFVNGWCPAQNLIYERAKRASQEFGDKVDFREIDTFNRESLEEWGIADGLFIDGKEINTGPPPSYDKIKKKIAGRVKKLKV